jgi:hypothetical protein
MKKLILSITGLLLLVLQVNAQTTSGGTEAIPAPKAPSKPRVSVSGSVRPSTPTPAGTITATGSNASAPHSVTGVNVVGSTYAYTATPSAASGSVNVTGNTVYAAAPSSIASGVNVSNYTYTWNDTQESDDPMKTKTFTKSFALDKSDKVNLSNMYGSITIKIWDKNEIKVDADIKAYANTESEAQKLLDDVSVKATKEGDQVTFKTSMEEHNGNWGRGSNNGKKWRREVKIYYTVYMPKNNALNVSQEYGTIAMDDFNGPTNLRVQYGSIMGGDLNNANNYISAQYAGAKFNDINQAKIKVEYGGGLTIGTIGTLDLQSQYTSVKITTIKNSGNIRHEYGGGINITNANNLTLNAHYIRTAINTLTGNVVAKLEYGGLSVANVETSVKSFNVTSDYATINLGFDTNYNANFTVSSDYSSFKYGSSVTAKKLGDEKGYSSSKSYSGQIGKGSAANNVTVKAEYGSVTFK